MCGAATTANAVAPGLVVGGNRALWQLGQVEVYDGGSDSDGDTLADNTLFAVQGVFGGRIGHPQHWTDDIEHAGKRVDVGGRHHHIAEQPLRRQIK